MSLRDWLFGREDDDSDANSEWESHTSEKESVETKWRVELQTGDVERFYATRETSKTVYRFHEFAGPNYHPLRGWVSRRGDEIVEYPKQSVVSIKPIDERTHTYRVTWEMRDDSFRNIVVTEVNNE